MSKQMKESWDRENWRHAAGVKYYRGETNAGLAERDYSVECLTPSQNKIMVIKGYWLWWCTPHHQPESWCQRSRLENKLEKVKRAISDD